MTTFSTLWFAALERYREKTGHDLAEEEGLDALLLCHTVAGVMLALEEEMGSFKAFHAGHPIWTKLRRAMEPVINTTLLVSETVGEAVSGLPGGKAIFVAMSVLLKATKGLAERYAALLELFEKLGSFLERLNLRMRALTSPSKNLIVDIFVHLLGTLALSTKLLKKHRFMHYMQTLFGSQDMKEALERLDKLTAMELQMTAAETLATTAEVLEKVELTRETVAAVWDLHVDAGIQTWLSPPDPATSHNAISRLRHGKSGMWLLNSEMFTSWKTRCSSILWIHGKPGSGKSVLTSSVIDHLRQTSKVVFFYFDFREVRKQGARGLLSSLVVQLGTCSVGALQYLRDFHRARWQDGEPSLGTLEVCLRDILRAVTDTHQDLFVVLDALDECPVQARRAELLPLLRLIASWSIPRLHIVAASRPEVDIRACMTTLKTHELNLHDEPEQALDLRQYIDDVLSNDPEFEDWSPSLVQLASSILDTRASGMFRWVYCQITNLRSCLPKNVEQALHSLPKDLDGTYERALRSIEAVCVPDVCRVFQCIAFSGRSLAPEELAEALAVDFNTQPLPRLNPEFRVAHPEHQLLKLCAGLIEIVPDSNSIRVSRSVVRFAHFSVQEYLLSERLPSAMGIFRLDAHLAHAHLFQLCLSFLLAESPGKALSSHLTGPLADYAVVHWAFHARQLGTGQSSARSALDLSFAHQGYFSKLVNVLTQQRGNESGTSPLYLAASHGLVEQTKMLLAAPHHADINALSRARSATFVRVSWCTALHGAAGFGHLPVVELLVQHGADIRAEDDEGRTALMLAASAGHTSVVAYLIEKHPDGLKLRCHRYGYTALHYAAQEKFGPVEMLYLLLHHGAQTESRSGAGVTSLHLAAARGRVDFLQALVTHGANVNARNPEGDESALQLAARSRRFDAVQFLVKNGARVDQDNAAILRAAEMGSVEIVSLLLSHGANPNARDPQTRLGALHVAAAQGHLEIARILLQHNARIDAFDAAVLTPTALQLAAQNENKEVVRLLVEHGVEGWRELQYALAIGDLGLARVLQDCGVVI